MNLLQKRPLAAVLLLFLLGSVFSFLFPGKYKIWVAVLFFIVAGICLFLRRRVYMCAALALSLAAALSLYTFYLRPTPYTIYDDSSVTVNATVEKVIGDTDYGTTVCYVSLQEINGKSLPFSPYPAYVSVRLPKEIGVRHKDTFTAAMTIRPITEDDGDASLYRLADGVVAEGKSLKLMHYTRQKSADITDFAEALRKSLEQRLIRAVGGESAALASEVLLGSDATSPATGLAFRRLGLSHMLAVSGMHLSVLAFFILFILKKLHVTKTARHLLLIAFFVFYVLLTGMQASVIRAAVMYTVMLFSFIIGKNYDSVTALLFAAAGMLIAAPYLSVNVSFLLSVFATFGILAVMDAEKQRRIAAKAVLANDSEKRGIGFRFLAYIRLSFLLTAGATLSTLPVIAVLFGEISVFSPIANLLLSPLMTAEIILSLLTVICPVPPFSFLCALSGNVILFLAQKLSCIPGILLSLRIPGVRESAVVGVFLFFTFLCLPIRKKRLLFSPLVITFAVVALFCSTHALAGYHRMTVHYLADDDGENTVISAGGRHILFVAGGTPRGIASVLSDAAADGVTELSAVILDVDAEDLLPVVEKIAGRIRTRTIYIPASAENVSPETTAKVRALTASVNMELIVYSDAEKIAFSDMSVVFKRAASASGSSFFFTVGYRETRMTYLACDFLLLSGNRVLSDSAAAESDILIFGKARAEYTDAVDCRPNPQKLRYVVIGDTRLDFIVGDSAGDALKNARVIKTPASCRLVIP